MESATDRVLGLHMALSGGQWGQLSDSCYSCLDIWASLFLTYTVMKNEHVCMQIEHKERFGIRLEFCQEIKRGTFHWNAAARKNKEHSENRWGGTQLSITKRCIYGSVLIHFDSLKHKGREITALFLEKSVIVCWHRGVIWARTTTWYLHRAIRDVCRFVHSGAIQP